MDHVDQFLAIQETGVLDREVMVRGIQAAICLTVLGGVQAVEVPMETLATVETVVGPEAAVGVEE